MMDNVPRETLCDIVAQRQDILSRTGRSVLEDVKLCEGLLRDHCGEFKLEISVLLRALEEHVAADLLASQDGVPQEIVLSRLSRRLQDRHALNGEAARWAVESWALALGIVSPDDLSTLPRPKSRPSASLTIDPAGSPPLKPYTLCTGQVATAPGDLPKICDADWDRAVRHFTKGYMIAWLRDAIPGLRAVHRHGPADYLEEVAAKGEKILRGVEGCGTHTRSIGLEKFLRALGGTAPTVKASPNTLQLPPTGTGERGESVVLTISNQSRGYLYGRVSTTASWLEVTPKHFGCPSRGSCRIQVQPQLSAFSAGRIEARRAIRVESNGGDLDLPAKVEVLPPRLEVVTSRLDFGQVGLGEYGHAALGLRNSGPGFLSGAVQPQVEWLSVSPSDFRVASGQRTQLRVTINSAALRAGKMTQHEALMVRSNGGQSYVHAQAQVLPPRLHTEAQQIVVTADPEDGGTQTLTIANTGAGVLDVHASIQSSMDCALQVEPQTVSCCSGESASLVVTVEATGLASKGTPPSGKLVLETNGGNKEVPIATVLRGPWLHIETDEIDLGCYQHDPPPTGLLCMKNLGDQEVRGRIEVQDSWLETTGLGINIPPGESVCIQLQPVPEHPVKLRLKNVVRRSLSSVAHVRTNGGKADIPVRLISEYHG